MIEQYRHSLIQQFQAALSMLNDCLSQCRDENWDRRVGNFPFWHVACHVIFYADLYLSPDEQSFTPPTFHRENYHFFGRLPWPPHETVVADIPYDRETLVHYVRHCCRKASEAISAETPESLDGPSGFWWYRIPRFEFHLNNIRHIQHHAAQLSLYLRNSAGIDIGWVGSGFKDRTGD